MVQMLLSCLEGQEICVGISFVHRDIEEKIVLNSCCPREALKVHFYKVFYPIYIQVLPVL